MAQEGEDFGFFFWPRSNRATSTVRREIARPGGRPAYRAHDADHKLGDRLLRPKRRLPAMNRKLRDIVASRLILDWSPEQITNNRDALSLVLIGPGLWP